MNMPDALGVLELRVAAAVDLIASLRERVSRLEREIESSLAAGAAAPREAPAPSDTTVLEELARLRAERGLLRERIRELITEFDRVSS
jgi:hypothetical protein